MRKMILTAMLGLLQISAFAETNALIEVKLFKDWVIKGEEFGGNFNLAIKNTGTDPILLAQKPLYFSVWQLAMRPLPHKPDYSEDELHGKGDRATISKNGDYFFELPTGETHVYEGWKFFLSGQTLSFSEEVRFTVSVYLGKGFWLDSEPVMLKGIIPDSEEKVGVITDINGSHDLVAVTCKNERWLYSKSADYWSICPISLTNKIRVEPHDGKRLYKIWDGEKSMIYRDGQMILLEGPDENDVFGKWTRERKQKAEADNAEVRRKKAEEEK
ncbi:MAG: hypothetical protein FWG50_02450 [Kiritimatiellaeota bacterium]|nr:hypothetical protein [Kiritimatiellota bacterium]